MDTTVPGPGLKASNFVAQAAEELSVTVCESTTSTVTTDDANHCLHEDNDLSNDNVILNVKEEEVFGGNAQGSAHSCTVIQQLCSSSGWILNTSLC